MKLYFIFISFFISTFFFSGCSVKNFAYTEKNINNKNIIKSVDKYSYNNDLLFEWKISKGDRVEIQAYNQSSSAKGQLNELLSRGGEQFSQNRQGDEGILIGANGKVLLPLIGEVNILGLTESQAAAKLLSEYKKYLKNPYISVKVLNQKLFVLGEVKTPGVVLVTNGTMNLFEALAKSGDLTDYANRTNIKILRGSMRNPIIREVNLNDLNAIKLSSLILIPNDVIYVEPRGAKAIGLYYNEQLPFWRLIGAMLSPLTSTATSTAVIYGVTK